MAYNFTQRNFVANCLPAKCDFRLWKTAVLRFEPPWEIWGQRTIIILSSLESA